ncbi:hypothetical protein COCSADRAFT_62413, partial [Bipolaris sorokiniana ND90Pr]
MTYAQQEQERQANKSRRPAPTYRLRPAANDPFPSQQTDDTNPTATVVQDNENNEEHLE